MISCRLVDARSFQAYFAAVAAENQVAVVKLKLGCAIELQLRLSRICAGSKFEVILQMALVAVENQVDSGVDIRVVDGCELRNVRVPLLSIVADEVVAFARKRLGSSGSCRPVSACEVHAQELVSWLGMRRVGSLQRESGACAVQKKTVSRAMREEFHGGVGLALVRFEDQRELAKDRTSIQLRG